MRISSRRVEWLKGFSFLPSWLITVENRLPASLVDLSNLFVDSFKRFSFLSPLNSESLLFRFKGEKTSRKSAGRVCPNVAVDSVTVRVALSIWEVGRVLEGIIAVYVSLIPRMYTHWAFKMGIPPLPTIQSPIFLHLIPSEIVQASHRPVFNPIITEELVAQILVAGAPILNSHNMLFSSKETHLTDKSSHATSAYAFHQVAALARMWNVWMERLDVML